MVLVFFKVEIKNEMEIGVDGGDQKIEVGSNVELQHQQQSSHELKMGEIKMEDVKIEEVPQQVIVVTQHSPQQHSPAFQPQKIVVIPSPALQTTVITTPRPRMITTAGHIR